MINYLYTEYKADCSIVKQTKAIEAFIERHEALALLFTMKNLEIGMSFDIDICELYNDDKFIEQWATFKDEICENPTETLNCMKLAIHQVHIYSYTINLNYYNYL